MANELGLFARSFARSCAKRACTYAVLHVRACYTLYLAIHVCVCAALASILQEMSRRRSGEGGREGKEEVSLARLDRAVSTRHYLLKRRKRIYIYACDARENRRTRDPDLTFDPRDSRSKNPTFVIALVLSPRRHSDWL